MQKFIYILLTVWLLNQSVHSQEILYSPAWFGPNANPVPETSNGEISTYSTISLSGNYYFGFGDQTRNLFVKTEVPLLAEKVSLSVWATLAENYEVTPALALQRNMKELKGKAKGDVYIQTKFLITGEKKYIPGINGRISLKTAAGNNVANRRFFDTPGYFFDFEIYKYVYSDQEANFHVKTIMNLGFFSWETNNSVQNDAPIYGLNVILIKNKIALENSLSGYYGWMSIKNPNYGDRPLVYTSKINYTNKKNKYFIQYQYGIKDFPYHHLSVGTALELDKLTPHYK